MGILTDIKQKANHSGIGGKAKNLALLEELNIQIPKWTVIPQMVLLEQFEDGKLNQEKVSVPSEILLEIKEFFWE